MDILAANDLCRALYGGVLDEDKLPLNLARYLFLDPTRAASSWTGTAWPTTWSARCGCRPVVTPRQVAGDLIGELSTRSDEFAARWARQNVRLHRTARKTAAQPVVGDIELTGDALETARRRLVLIAYTADPGSRPRTS